MPRVHFLTYQRVTTLPHGPLFAVRTENRARPLEITQHRAAGRSRKAKVSRLKNRLGGERQELQNCSRFAQPCFPKQTLAEKSRPADAPVGKVPGSPHAARMLEKSVCVGQEGCWWELQKTASWGPLPVCASPSHPFLQVHVPRPLKLHAVCFPPEETAPSPGRGQLWLLGASCGMRHSHPSSLLPSLLSACPPT